MIPIWQDVRCTLVSTGSSIENYYIADGNGTKLFTGRAYTYPGNTDFSFVPNKIAENYIDLDLDGLTSLQAGSMVHEQASKQFIVRDSDTERLLGNYTFYWNWSNDTSINSNPTVEDSILSVPVNGHYSIDMYKFQTKIPVNSSAVTTDWSYGVTSDKGYTVSACGDYALYYLNRNGGFDSFLIEGKVVESDVFSRSEYEKYGYGNIRYRNEITHSWEFGTGWLTDKQSRTIAKHLFSSNKIYLHDMTAESTGKLVPVDIVDTEVEYKTFANERKMVAYTIKVRESNKSVIF